MNCIDRDNNENSQLLCEDRLFMAIQILKYRYLRSIIHHFFLDFQLLFPYNENALIGISNGNILLTFFLVYYTSPSPIRRFHSGIPSMPGRLFFMVVPSVRANQGAPA